MITAGRSVTWILQKLRSREATFKSWYEPIREEMKADSLLRYFNKIRTILEKEGMPKPVRATMDFLVDDLVVGTAEVGIWGGPVRIVGRRGIRRCSRSNVFRSGGSPLCQGAPATEYPIARSTSRPPRQLDFGGQY